MKKISIVTPTFNEEENIERLCKEIKIEAETLNYDYEDLETYQSSLSSVFSLASQNIEKAYATDENKTGTQSKGFIPINLSLDLDGLSGPKIFEKFKIPDTFLPSSYKGNVNFIIKDNPI